jgi:hypothetical protein
MTVTTEVYHSDTNRITKNRSLMPKGVEHTVLRRRTCSFYTVKKRGPIEGAGGRRLAVTGAR